MEGFRFRKLESGGDDALFTDHTPSANTERGNLDDVDIIIRDTNAVNAATAVRRPLSHADQTGEFVSLKYRF